MYWHPDQRGALARIALLASLAIPAFAAHSASAEPAALTLIDAFNAALRSNPELRGLEFQVRVLDARVDRARLRPPLALTLGTDQAFGTGIYQGTGESETTLSLAGAIELGGKRSARTQAAEAERRLFDVERSARQLDILADVTRRFVTVVARQERLKSLRAARTLAEETLAGAERRVKAAKSPHVEVDRARLALERSRLDEERATSELESARRQLAATWGATDAELNGAPLGEARADLFRMPVLPGYAELSARLDGNPDFLRFASEARLRDAEIRLAEADRRPDIGLALGVTRFQASHDQAVVASISVPLFSGQRAQPLIAEARANRNRVDAAETTARVRATAVLFELHRALGQAIREVETLRNDMLPRMSEALRETQYAYDRGRYSYLELVDAQREYVALQSALISASTDAHLLQAEIERLTRLPLEKAPLTTDGTP